MRRSCIFLIPLLTLVGISISCRTKDMRTIVIHIPEMKNPACCDIVMGALSRTPGLAPEQPQIDMVHRTVTVTYDSLLLSVKNIEFNIANAGFTANLIPANEEAKNKLPPECAVDATATGLSSTDAQTVIVENPLPITPPAQPNEPAK